MNDARRAGGLPAGLDDELTAHLAAAVLNLEITVEGKGAGPVGAELEGYCLTGVHAFGNSIGVDGHAVRDVVRVQLDFDEVVLVDLDARRIELVPAGRDDRRAD